jgi:hypothetical protein
LLHSQGPFTCNRVFGSRAGSLSGSWADHNLHCAVLARTSTVTTDFGGSRWQEGEASVTYPAILHS